MRPVTPTTFAGLRGVGHDAVVTSPVSDAPAPHTGVCVRCLHEATLDIGGVWLCVDCYHVAGSTCSGIGTPATPADPTC